MNKALLGEFSTAELADRRLGRRLEKIASAVAADPSRGFPRLLNDAELEGYYRFVNNEKVSFEPVFAAHRAATVLRVQSAQRVVVAHDTTDFRFRNETWREGLGPMDNGGQGFYAHFALASAGAGLPLGVLAVETWVREPRPPMARKPTQSQKYKDPKKESLRWGRGVNAVAAALRPTGATVIHVADREADDYAFLAKLVADGHRFVVRASTDRRLIADEGTSKLKSFVRELPIDCERTATLSSRRKNRPAKQKKLYPPRTKRSAVLSFSAEALRLQRPDKASRHLPTELGLNVVYVTEPNPPDQSTALEWILYTTEPIASETEIFQVADDYRQRWGIEEFFKSLKTGCAYEKRQHESYSALLNALAIFIPIAWWLLNIRTMARSEELNARDAREVFSDTHLHILRHKSNGKLPEHPNVRQAMLAVARYFGGHLPSNGEPGWQVLGRGIADLLMAEVGWKLALAYLEKPPRCDR